jgi:predicted adenine nucleotide alpha hydrolase (AANH) superfamily ATPase
MKKLLLHACCAPCSSSVLERTQDYDTTVFFYNPNIKPFAEYERRLLEMSRLNCKTIEGARDFENYTPTSCEGGDSCSRCIKSRLRETAKFAKANNFDVFATTLTVSPHKNAELINKIGSEICAEFNIEYLPSNWKKQNGYLRSLELSRELGLYRQVYCGCLPSPRHCEEP